MFNIVVGSERNYVSVLCTGGHRGAERGGKLIFRHILMSRYPPAKACRPIYELTAP